MDVLEAPPLTDNSAPIDTFVVLSVDPVSSVAALKDKQATEEAAALPANNKFVGIVRCVRDSHDQPEPR